MASTGEKAFEDMHPQDANASAKGSAKERMRLQKFLARCGAGGRRRCESLIAAGRVKVNGATVIQMGVQVDPKHDVITLDGKRMALPQEDVVIALNKPAGCYTTMKDQKGRFCVADLLPLDAYPSLYHVGRLDRDTTGIILFTMDGELGNYLLHPRHHVEKEYIAQVRRVPTEEELERIRRGITIRRGERLHECAPAKVELLRKLPRSLTAQDSCLDPSISSTSFVRISIHEGINHQVKLMMGAIGHPVVRLHRTRFGSVACGSLPQGEWRELSPEEVAALRQSA